jgi:hypothetical protein
LAGDLDSGLTAFLVAGITVAGALVFGRRWWSSYLLLTSIVALVLLLAPDAYAALGLTFLVAIPGVASVARASAQPGLQRFNGRLAW